MSRPYYASLWATRHDQLSHRPTPVRQRFGGALTGFTVRGKADNEDQESSENLSAEINGLGGGGTQQLLRRVCRFSAGLCRYLLRSRLRDPTQMRARFAHERRSAPGVNTTCVRSWDTWRAPEHDVLPRNPETSSVERKIYRLEHKISRTAPHTLQEALLKSRCHSSGGLPVPGSRRGRCSARLIVAVMSEAPLMPGTWRAGSAAPRGVRRAFEA